MTKNDYVDIVKLIRSTEEDVFDLVYNQLLEEGDIKPIIKKMELLEELIQEEFVYGGTER